MSAERSLSEQSELAKNKQNNEAENAVEQLGSWERRGKLLKLGAKALAMALATGVPATAVSLYGFDVNYTKGLMEHAHPYVIENSPVPESTDVPTLPVPEGVYRAMDATDRTYIDTLMKPSRWAFFNGPGFGRNDTFQAASTLSGFDKYGANVSLHYGNNGINIPAITEKAVEYIKDSQITDVVLYGDSLGSDVVLSMAVKMLELCPDVHIRAIILDAPAIDASVVRPQSVSDAYSLLNAANLPDAGYSRIDCQIAELYVRRDEILKDPSKLPAINGEVYKEIYENHDLASNNMSVDQAQILFDPKSHEAFTALGKLPEGERPLIQFMGAADPEMDDIVNTPKSYALIKKWTKQSHLTLLSPRLLKDYHHGAQWMDKAEYKKVIPEIMLDIMAALDAKSPSN